MKAHRRSWLRVLGGSTLGVSTAVAAAGDGVRLNEIRIDDPGNAEYAELIGPPNASLDGLTLLVIGDGSAGDGAIEELTDLTGQSLGPDGLFLIAEDNNTFGAAADLITNLNFENNDNVTVLLVDGFTGVLNGDIDDDDDGVVNDPPPWAEVLDAIGLIESPNPPIGTEFSYGAALGFVDIGPDADNGNNVPSHVFRCDPTEVWTIGHADGDDVADRDDTPGAPNGACPPNDDCSSALATGPGDVAFDTTDASTDGPSHGGCFDGSSQIHNDVWFSFTPECSGEILVSTCGEADFDTRIAVYAAGSCPVTDGDLLACNDDAGGCPGGTSALSVELDEGVKYLVRVGGATADASGVGTVRIAPTPRLSVETIVPDAEFEPGDPVFLEVRLSGLCGLLAAGFQAFIQFDCDQIEFVSGEYTDEPFGQHIISPIVADGGAIDLASGINQIGGQMPTSADALLATLEFTSLIPVADPDVSFRPQDPLPTRLSDPFGNEILPLELLGATCPADTNHDDEVDVDDLVLVILSWGQSICAADANGDGIVDVDDLLAVILGWGPCP